MAEGTTTYKNVAGHTLHVGDVANVEIPPDGLIDTDDMPMLNKSVHFRRFVALNFLVEDPSKGRKIGSDQPPEIVTHVSKKEASSKTQTPQEVTAPREVVISDDQLDTIINKTASLILAQLGGERERSSSASSEASQEAERKDVSEDERIDVMNAVISTAGELKHRFGDLSESDDEMDIGRMADNIRNMRGSEEVAAASENSEKK